MEKENYFKQIAEKYQYNYYLNNQYKLLNNVINTCKTHEENLLDNFNDFYIGLLKINNHNPITLEDKEIIKLFSELYNCSEDDKIFLYNVLIKKGENSNDNSASNKN